MRVSAFLSLALVLAGCGSSGEPSPAGEDVTLTDDGCSARSDALPTGDTVLSVRNASSTVGNFELLRIETSFEDLATHVTEEQQRIIAGEPLANIPDFVTEAGRVELAAGEAGTLAGTVTAGTYAVVCAQLEGNDVTALYVAGPLSVSD